MNAEKRILKELKRLEPKGVIPLQKNEPRYSEVKKIIADMKEYFLELDKDAQFETEMDEFTMCDVYFTVKSYYIAVSSAIGDFGYMLAKADNFDIIANGDGQIEIGFCFHDCYEYYEPENPYAR